MSEVPLISNRNRSQAPSHPGMVQPNEGARNVIPCYLSPVPVILIGTTVECVVNFITSNNPIDERNFLWN